MSISSSASRLQELLPQLFQANLPPGEPYLRFQLTAQTTALMSMGQVQESLFVSAELIAPLPNMPESVIGMMSSRNHVFCVIDLAQMLKLPSPLISSRQYPIIVLQTTSEQPIYFGLAVAQIKGIMRITTEQIQSSPYAFPKQLAPYICGAIQQQETTLPVLDFNHLLETLTTTS